VGLVEVVHRLQAAAAFQPRPELDALREWWAKDARGVCALVGLGGSGKTAIAERFVRDLDAPETGVFVYSFYEEPSAEAFFERLGAWIGGAAHFEVMAALRSSERRNLLVLDGLERVQSDDGEIGDVPLSDLILRAATGMLGSTAILVTTRLAITPLELEPTAHLRRIDVGGLSMAAARALFEARGAQGTDDAMLDRFGRHALLIDLAASYIAAFGGTVDVEPELGGAELLAKIAPEHRALLELQRKFASMARQYRTQLETKEPEAWALLRLACLFRTGVSQQTLINVLRSETGRVLVVFEVDSSQTKALESWIPHAVESANSALAENVDRRALLNADARRVSSIDTTLAVRRYAVSLDRSGMIRASPTDGEGEFVEAMRFVFHESAFETLHDAILGAALTLSRASLVRDESGSKALDLLHKLGLVDARGDRVLVHPAIREGFQADFESDATGAHRRAALGVLTGVNLARRPGTVESRISRRDAEEIIHHLIGAGEARRAWRFYHHDVGGFATLGAREASYSFGESLCRMFDPPDSLTQPERASFFNEWGMYLERLGQLIPAAHAFEQSSELLVVSQLPGTAAIAEQNRADTLRLLGRLPEAREAVIKAMALFEGTNEEPPPAEQRIARGSRIELMAQLVRIGLMVRQIQGRPDVDMIADLVRREAWSTAERECRYALSGAQLELGDTSAYHAHLFMYLAEIAREQGEIERALGHAFAARVWAVKHGDREILARSYVETTRASLELTRSPEVRALWEEAYREGLRTARDSGYGSMAIDLWLNRAELAILDDDPELAREHLDHARYGSDDLLGADSPASGYGRGKRRAALLEQHLAAKTRPTPKAKKTSGEILVCYDARDGQWLEQLLEALDGHELLERVTLWRDGLRPHEAPAKIDRAQVIVVLAGKQGPPADIIQPLLMKTKKPTRGVDLGALAQFPGAQRTSSSADIRSPVFWWEAAEEIASVLPDEPGLN